MKILDKIAEHYHRKLPFVTFRKPNSNNLKAYLCGTDELKITHSFEEQGFVFAPFDDTEGSVMFDLDECQTLEEDNIFFSIDRNFTGYRQLAGSSRNHIELVKKGVKAIENGDLRKIVLSRKEVLEHDRFSFLDVFQRLLNLYNNAFVYLWYHPKVGMWFGATPERLVSLEKNKFLTMALAGTQLYHGNINPEWGDKEIIEHQFVIDYIVSQIRDTTNGIILNDFKVSETYTSKAGNLLHLKADIEGEIGNFNLKELLKTLHPTPAVCGLPKEESKEFILNNEPYNRSYYSGFLGEINMRGKTELFVNLRCAEAKDDKLNIYVGGGITKDSDPRKEWEETKAKTQTIIKAL